MLRRKQVLVSDWLDDFVNYVSKRYDISYSEVIRVSVAYMLTGILAGADSKYEMTVTWEDLAQVLQKSWENEGDLENTRKVISDVYWDAKKILSDRMAKIKSNPKNEIYFK